MDLLKLFDNAEDARDFAPGAVLFTEDEPGQLMYVILHGEVEVRSHGHPVAVCGPGEMIGELALIDEGGRSATAIARGECCLAPLDEQRFLALVRQTPEFALHVMRELARKLRHMNDIHGG